MKEEIIKSLVLELNQQRGKLLKDISELSPSDMNYSTKRLDLSNEIISIDNQISNYLLSI